MKQRKPTQRTVTFALGAVLAFFLVAVLNLVEALRGEPRWHLLSAGGFAVAAGLWWLVAVSWKRKLHAS
ncbi:MAG TPA: hypothetical protein VJP85_02050 [Candidatus Baltobacteraceae bacterium]|nr:hypothetical protein [Candidatus Baltobacteraceae bacterium]